MEKNSPSHCALLLGLLASASVAAAEFHCASGELAPFEAEYRVVRNEKLFGHAELTLAKDDDGSWTYTMDTEADKGLAGFLGGQVLEQTRFDYVQGKPRSLSYRYKRGTSLSSRSTFAEFDWAGRRASGNYKKKEWSMPLGAGHTDRMLVNIKLMQALAGGAPELAFDTVEKGRLDRLSFVREGELQVETGFGDFATVAVERQHRDPARKTHSWHAPKLAYLPVRLQQLDTKDNENIELILEKVEFQSCE